MILLGQGITAIKGIVLLGTLLVLFLFGALDVNAAYSLSLGQSISVQKTGLNPAVVEIKLGALNSISSQTWGISTFGNSYTVDMSEARVLDTAGNLVGSQSFSIGRLVNIAGFLDPIDASLIHASLAQDSGAGSVSVDSPPSGDSTAGDSEPAGPLGPSVCFEAPGLFHEPRVGEEIKRFEFPLPLNTSYVRNRIDLDVTVGPWAPENPRARHNIFWYPRSTHRDLFGYVMVQGPSANNAVLRHGIGQSHTFKPRAAKSVTLVPGRTYNFAYLYRVQPTRDIELTITDAETLQVVARLTSVPDVPGINVGSKKFMIQFGFIPVSVSGILDERPTYGWQYKNLRVSFVGVGGAPQTCTSVTGESSAADSGTDSDGGSSDTTEGGTGTGGTGTGGGSGGGGPAGGGGSGPGDIPFSYY